MINTQHVCSPATQVMLREVLALMKEEPPILIDWLPWNHTFGGNHNVGLVLFNGGSLYIDDGKPTPGGLTHDPQLAGDCTDHLLQRPEGLGNANPTAARRPDAPRALLQQTEALFLRRGRARDARLGGSRRSRNGDRRCEDPHAHGARGRAAPFALSVTPETSRSGHVGLPVPGNDLKLVPNAGKLEASRSSNVTPGYWRRPGGSRIRRGGDTMFGDALRFVDENDVSQGLPSTAASPRTSNWRAEPGSASAPSAQLIEACSPYVRDFVIAGLNRDEIGVLAIPDVEACRSLCTDLPADAPRGQACRRPTTAPGHPRGPVSSGEEKHGLVEPRHAWVGDRYAAIDRQG